MGSPFPEDCVTGPLETGELELIKRHDFMSRNPGNLERRWVSQTCVEFFFFLALETQRSENQETRYRAQSPSHPRPGKALPEDITQVVSGRTRDFEH